ncbi:hypothetical protein [Actinocorallia longicatena]|uniref:Uncharacterized protein n=1 Tax=Actinocorallia longicatena TaxID=111803 RepID=A0ABP6QMU8_9ACTN
MSPTSAEPDGSSATPPPDDTATVPEAGRPPLIADPDGDLEDIDIPGLEGLTLGGRGLSIVATLAVTTGACGSPHIGHTVWADLEVTCPTDPFPEVVTA